MKNTKIFVRKNKEEKQCAVNIEIKKKQKEEK
jgi:hypothetical protein